MNQKKTICGHCAGTVFIETERGTTAECAECDCGYIEVDLSPPKSFPTQVNVAKEEIDSLRLYSYDPELKSYTSCGEVVKEIVQEAIAGERERIEKVIQSLRLIGQFESEWINKLAKKVKYEEYAEINNEIIDEILSLLTPESK